MKVIVTGDPGWTDMARVREILRAYWDLSRALGEGMEVGHLGQEGVDQEVDRWARRMDGVFLAPGMTVTLTAGFPGQEELSKYVRTADAVLVFPAKGHGSLFESPQVELRRLDLAVNVAQVPIKMIRED